MKTLTIIGGGASALMLAAEIDTQKYEVTICEKKKSFGRKFLVAGEGGLNLTFNAEIEELINQYSPKEFMETCLRAFTNEDLIQWLKNLEIPTFIGSSNRVFPEMGMKPIEVLNKIVAYISSKNITFKFSTEWKGWNENGQLYFENGEIIESDITVFALGGASWKVTGSDGQWKKVFEEREIKVNHFRAANCAFEVDWDKNFISTHEGKPLKNIALSFEGLSIKGELVISEFGLEGNAIYPLSEKIQDKLLSEKSATIYLDLKPTLTSEQIKSKYINSKKNKVTDILSKDLKLDRISIGILKQFSSKSSFADVDLLAKIIKAVPVVIKSAEEIDKAISTLGGVDLDEVDENFQLKKLKNSYVIGEMLDWYAPTGGYLLQGSFSMGYTLAKNLMTNIVEH